MFEMAQVLPGVDPGDFDADPIVEASELNAAGDHAGACEVLMKLLAADLRCLDAHAHLGNFELDRRPAQALRHYEVGLGIGALSLGTDFEGVLPWGLIDNRPFLPLPARRRPVVVAPRQDPRGRRGLSQDAVAQPGDNQGARFELAAVEADQTWEEMEG
jgi:hypothetical protein